MSMMIVHHLEEDFNKILFMEKNWIVHSGKLIMKIVKNGKNPMTKKLM